jgi:hypothetical protein
MDALFDGIEQCDGAQCGNSGIELSTLEDDSLVVDRLAVCSEGDQRLDAEVEPKWMEEFKESWSGEQIAMVSIGDGGC